RCGGRPAEDDKHAAVRIKAERNHRAPLCDTKRGRFPLSSICVPEIGCSALNAERNVNALGAVIAVADEIEVAIRESAMHEQKAGVVLRLDIGEVGRDL